MKAVLLSEPGNISLADIKMPVPGEGEALIKIVSAGICGTDISSYKGGNNRISYPRVIGHELAGVIESIPDDNPKGLKKGDRVIVDPYLYCGHCYPCRIGRTNCCTDLKVLGVQTDGGMSEYFCHPADMLIKMPDEMSFIEAAMAEPLTIALHGIHRGGLKAGEHCVIVGAGPIGILAGMTAEAYGAHVIMIDLISERLTFAKSLGIEHVINLREEDAVSAISDITGGDMAELVMECSGSNSAVRATLDYVSYAGRVTLTGWPKKETPLPTEIITLKEIDVRGARTSAGEFPEAVDLICSGKVNVGKLLTKTAAPEEAPETIRDMAVNPGDYVKVEVMF